MKHMYKKCNDKVRLQSSNFGDYAKLKNLLPKKKLYAAVCCNSQEKDKQFKNLST